MLEVFLRSLYCQRTREIGFKLIFGLMHQLLLWSGCMNAAFNSGSLIEHFYVLFHISIWKMLQNTCTLKESSHSFILLCCMKTIFWQKWTNQNKILQTNETRYYRLKIILISASNRVYQLLKMLRLRKIS